jgi:hypothetical protein
VAGKYCYFEDHDEARCTKPATRWPKRQISHSGEQLSGKVLVNEKLLLRTFYEHAQQPMDIKHFTNKIGKIPRKAHIRVTSITRDRMHKQQASQISKIKLDFYI